MRFPIRHWTFESMSHLVAEAFRGKEETLLTLGTLGSVESLDLGSHGAR